MKKNLIIILIMPFVVALIGIVSLNLTFRANYSDLVSIDWSFRSLEAVSLEADMVEVTASPVVSSSAKLAPGNDKLRYTLINKDSNNTDTLAHLIYNGKAVEVSEDGSSTILVDSATRVYVKPLQKGEVILKVENEKGNVSTNTEFILYKTGIIFFNSVIPNSQNNIDTYLYYGTNDYDEELNKVAGEIEFVLSVAPASLKEELIIDKSDNVLVELDYEAEEENGGFINIPFKLKPQTAGDAYFTFKTDETYQIDDDVVDSRTLDFKVVDGINIYTYQELLQATNRSQDGETICLRKNFLDLETYNARGNDNDELFGTYNEKKKTFSFASEIYEFETTYNQEYIKEWNIFADESKNNFKDISNKVKAGLHIQKDVYGNGFTINLHNLTYPKINGLTLDDGDLFRGPLPFYCLGDPNGMNFVKVYGQDNSGLYIDKEGVTINDLVVYNCNTPGAVEFYNYVGNVVDICASDVTIKNSRLQNGKNILRAFSSQNLLIDNCLLANSQNFLIITGANEYEAVNDLYYQNFSKDGTFDNQLNDYLQGTFTSKDSMRSQLETIQDALSDEYLVREVYKGSMVINDTFFYNSGLACICFESLFNGPFLYTGAPSLIGTIFDSVEFAKSIIPFIPTNISGVSYPVTVSLTGDNRFYDYKDVNNIDLSGLIEEHFSEYLGQESIQNMIHRTITIDDIFPLKETLIQMANRNNCIFRVEDPETEEKTDYISIPICYYGGGLNLSKVISQPQSFTRETSTMRVDFANRFLNEKATPIHTEGGLDKSELIGAFGSVAVKSVVVAIGFEPFRFTLGLNNGNLFGEAPQISELQEHLLARE